MNNTNIWTFKYEPKSIDDMVIPDEMVPLLKKVIQEKPNLLLAGSPGIGKGTFANILLKETGCDFIKINASKENSIDDVRERISRFATTMNVGSTLKYVYLNEADSLSKGSDGSGGAQKSLRQLMEDVQGITRFILTCNYPTAIIDALKSRCQSIEFPNPPMKKLAKFCLSILKQENITEIDKSLIVSIIKKHTPDIRRIINTLQFNTIDGKLLKIIDINTDKSNQEILKAMLDSDIDNVRKTLRSNPIDYNNLYSFLYENVGEFKSPGDCIILIANALRDDNISFNKEINFMGMVCNGLKHGIL
jgi:replication factor C small subunit